MRAKQRRERIGGPVAGAGRYQIVYGVVQLIGSALKALQVVAKGARDGLLHGVGLLCHIVFGDVRAQNPVLALWKLGGFQSTA